MGGGSSGGIWRSESIRKSLESLFNDEGETDSEKAFFSDMLKQWVFHEDWVGPGNGTAQEAGGGGEAAVQEGSGKLQLMSRADMIHYLDVRNGWDLSECECCFDRALSYRAQRALGMVGFDGYRVYLHKQQLHSIPRAPLNPLTQDLLEFSSRVPMKGLEELEGAQAPQQLLVGFKCAMAPIRCAEAMLLEWMAEPRVGVLMDLEEIRSRIPAILASEASSTHGPSAAAAAVPGGSLDTSPCTWSAYRHAVSFAAFLTLVARCPRIVNLWRFVLDAYATVHPAVITALGAGRQGEHDCLASMLVQILGVKETADLQQGFGIHVQNLLSGGLEKVHARRAAVVDGGGGEQEQRDSMKGLMSMLSGSNGKEQGRKRGDCGYGVCDAGRDATSEDVTSGQWREHLKGPVWERYVDGMGWILKHGGGDGWEFRCSHCSDCSRPHDSRSSTSSTSSNSNNGSTNSVQEHDIPAGMYMSGVGATDFALTVAAVLSKPEYREEAEMYIHDGNNKYKTRVEDAAIETAMERERRDRARGEGVRGGDGAAATATEAAASSLPVPAFESAYTAAAMAGGGHVFNPGYVPVNSNPVLAAFTYRAACVLNWFRVYGSDLTSRSTPQIEVLEMRHPLRDLPSLLLRLGAIPKPLNEAGFSFEWEEWPQGNEAAMRLPDDPRARFFRLGIAEQNGVQEDSKTAEEQGKGGLPPEPAAMGGGKRKAGRRRRGKAGDDGGGVKGGATWNTGKGNLPAAGGLSAAVLSPPKVLPPAVRCRADVDFLVEAAGRIMDPPACAQCTTCFRTYISHIPFVTFIVTFAYRPAAFLLDHFISFYPPHSPGFNTLVAMLGLQPFPRETPAYFNLPVLRHNVEQVPVLFLLLVALNWPASMLDIDIFEGIRKKEMEGGGRFARRKLHKERKNSWRSAARGRGSVEDEGATWEEVRSWCFAATMAWPSSLRVMLNKPNPEKQPLEAIHSWKLSDPCEGSKEQKVKLKRVEKSRWVADMLMDAAVTRFSEQMEEEGGASSSSSSGSSGSSCDIGMGSSSNGSSSSSSSDSSKGNRRVQKAEVAAYLKPWPGGVNLVACLREMLLGQPCYRPAPHAAPRASAATPTTAFNVCSAAGCHENTRASAPCTRRVCALPGCDQVESGAVKLRRCGGCGKLAYCSRGCQKAHWPSHKLLCRPESSSKA